MIRDTSIFLYHETIDIKYRSGLPEADDVVGDHTTYLLDRDAITNINDAIAGFNFNQINLITKPILR